MATLHLLQFHMWKLDTCQGRAELLPFVLVEIWDS